MLLCASLYAFPRAAAGQANRVQREEEAVVSAAWAAVALRSCASARQRMEAVR